MIQRDNPDTLLRPIGRVHSSLKQLEECPKQGDEGAPEAWVEIEDTYADGLDTLEEGQTVTLVTWFHEAERDILAVHPRGDTARPKRGVFNTRSPDRPNPIGLHQVRLLEIKDNMLRVFPLEALDGTPVIDIKASFMQRKGEEENRTQWGAEIPAREADRLRNVCLRGWQRRLLSGFNGNVSIRLGDNCLVTCTGSAKGNLKPGDLAIMHIPTGKTLSGGKPSSEAMMHLEIYRNQPQANAVVHTHPPKMLALGTLVPSTEMLKLPVYESDLIRQKLTTVPAFEPGTNELAEAVGKAAMQREAIFMEQHGLAVWGPDAAWALSLSEELEHLAGIHLDVFVKQQ